MRSTLAPEVLLAGRYRLVNRLASGGMGLVWRAADEVLRRPVAVKLLRSEYAEDPAFVERFRAEARRTAALPHPGIASVFDYGEIEEPDLTAYLVMELVDGSSLSALLAREGRLDPERTMDVVAQAGLALGAAHQAGVVHRDVKPSNLLIRRDGLVKVTDFGIARATGEVGQTETGLVIGTAAYLSPEQVACRPVTPATDVYALGVVAYECLAGRRPFTAEHPVALALAHQRHRPPPLPSDVPEPVRALVEAAMAKDPEARPQSADILAEQALMTHAALSEGRPPGAAAHATALALAAANGWHGSAAWPTANGWHGPNGHHPDPDGPRTPADQSGPGRALGPTDRAEQGRTVRRREEARRPGPWEVDPAVARGEGDGVRTGAGKAALGAGGGQDTGEWRPASLLLTRAWLWSRRRGPLPVAALIALLTLLAVILTGATGQRAALIAVPSVHGLPIAKATQALARAGLEVREQRQASRSAAAGIVLAQSPSAGARLADGSVVTLTVSSGPGPASGQPATLGGGGASASPGAADSPAATPAGTSAQEGGKPKKAGHGHSHGDKHGES
jgi:eukaryotic-like serine/threonine-protein kinase